MSLNTNFAALNIINSFGKYSIAKEDEVFIKIFKIFLLFCLYIFISLVLTAINFNMQKPVYYERSLGIIKSISVYHYGRPVIAKIETDSYTAYGRMNDFIGAEGLELKEYIRSHTLIETKGQKLDKYYLEGGQRILLFLMGRFDKDGFKKLKE